MRRRAIVLLVLMSVCSVMSAAPPAGLSSYRVRLTLYPDEEARTVAQQVVSTYGGRPVSPAEQASVVAEAALEVDVEVSQSAARLLASDPRVPRSSR